MSTSILRLFLVVAVTFSLASLQGSLSSHFQLPTVQLGRAYVLPCPTRGASGACSDYWIPAGPSMDTFVGTIFTDGRSENNYIGSSTSPIDFTDSPATQGEIASYCPNTNTAIGCTYPIAEHGYVEIQFMLDNNFWGVDFQFGNNPNGALIRQGIAHLIDRSLFVADPASTLMGATAIDNPLPNNNGGLLAPNPCGWDIPGNNSATNCSVGAPGGTAYNLHGVRGGNGLSWLAAIGSADFCSAAKHFILAGLASGKNPDCTLTGQLAPSVTQNPVDFYIRVDDPAMFTIGQSVAEGICALFTGIYSLGCGVSPSTTNILTVHLGRHFSPPYVPAFSGFQTSVFSVNKDWWMYTAGYGSVYPFDRSLYYTYNSVDVSGFPGIQAPPAGGGTCSDASAPSFGAQNYMYVCSPPYDSLSSQMEFAPCVSAPGDPVLGATSNLPTPPGNGICPNTSSLSARSTGIQAEDYFGSHVLTIPVFEQEDWFVVNQQSGTWHRLINDDGSGLPNFFTWLDAWNPTPAQAGTVRQGFSQNTTSTNPYIASTRQDNYIVGNVYDSLYKPTPLVKPQLMDWMDSSSSEVANSVLITQGYNVSKYETGTVTNFEFTLRSDLYFQNGRQVTPWDVAYSYLSAVAAGAYESAGADVMSGFIVKNTLQFDISVNNRGALTQLWIGLLYVMPGEYWSNAGSSSYIGDISACAAQGADCNGIYTLGAPQADGVRTISCVTKTGSSSCGFPASAMQPDPAKIIHSYDPIAHSALIGSGPWQCGSGSSLGQGCAPGNVQNPQVGSSYTLTRFGIGTTPGLGLYNVYFRSAGLLALYIWSGQTGDPTHDFLNFAIVIGCYGFAPAPLTASPPSPSSCAHFQQGLGNPPILNNGPMNSDGTCNPAPPPTGHVPCTYTYPNPVLLSGGLGAVSRYYGINWVAPFKWVSSPPTGIDGPSGLVLYEGSTTLTPASTAGCGTFHSTDDINKLLAEAGYDC